MKDVWRVCNLRELRHLLYLHLHYAYNVTHWNPITDLGESAFSLRQAHCYCSFDEYSVAWLGRIQKSQQILSFTGLTQLNQDSPWPQIRARQQNFTFQGTLYRCKVNHPSKHSQNLQAARHLPNWKHCTVLCWHFLTDSQPNQHVIGSWCLPLPFHFHCECVHCITQKDRCWQDGDRFSNVCALSMSTDVLAMHSHTNTYDPESGEFTRSSVAICYQSEAGRKKYFKTEQ